MRNFSSNPVVYGNFTPEFVDDLAGRFKNKRVLEIYAGNGYFASLLRAKGVEMISTSLFSGHDGHERGMFSEVIEMEASSAIEEYGIGSDILLVSWPTTTDAMWRAAMTWRRLPGNRPILFIGEMYNPAYPNGGCAGCASDLFFESVETIEEISSYKVQNILERACLLQVRREHFEQYHSGRFVGRQR